MATDFPHGTPVIVAQSAPNSIAPPSANRTAVRHGRAYRDIFQLLREQLAQAPELVEQVEREFAIVRILLKSERQRYRH